MSKVDDLKKALADAEKQEEANNRERKLILAKTNYIGKCTATHTFSRTPDQFHGQANRVIDVELDDEGRVVLVCRYVDMIRYSYPFDKTIKVEVGQYKRSSNAYYHYRHDITIEQFEAMYNSVKADVLTTYANVKGIFKRTDEHQTMGEHGDIRGLMKNIDESGHPYLDLTEEKEFVKILSWEKCGLLVGNYLLLSEYTIPSIKNITTRLHRHAAIWSDRISAEDHRRIAILNKLIKLVKRQFKDAK